MDFSTLIMRICAYVSSYTQADVEEASCFLFRFISAFIFSHRKGRKKIWRRKKKTKNIHLKWIEWKWLTVVSNFFQWMRKYFFSYTVLSLFSWIFYSNECYGCRVKILFTKKYEYLRRFKQMNYGTLALVGICKEGDIELFFFVLSWFEAACCLYRGLFVGKFGDFYSNQWIRKLLNEWIRNRMFYNIWIRHNEWRNVLPILVNYWVAVGRGSVQGRFEILKWTTIVQVDWQLSMRLNDFF